MPAVNYRNRNAVQIETEHVRVTVLTEGGHVAEILDKQTGVNPLWTPPWPSIEPSAYDPARHPEYGGDSESKLLAGIMGHNLCLDLFGAPSPDESAAGMTFHGEAGVAKYDIESGGTSMVCRCRLEAAQLAFERRIRIEGGYVLFDETVENLSILDRPSAWTQHVTLGPPFLARGETQLRIPAIESMKYAGSKFTWPLQPREDGGLNDLRTYTSAAVSENFTSHLLDPTVDPAWFLAYAPASKTLFGYVWQRSDFPFIGIWEENHCRTSPPWNGQTMTCGMEFGASALPEPRRKMIERGTAFGVPGYRWLPARSKTKVSYYAFIGTAPSMPERPPVIAL